MTRITTIITVTASIAVSAQTAQASWYFTTDEVGVVAELVGEDLVDPVEYGPNRTYRIYAVVPPGWRVDALAGNDSTPLSFEVVGGSFFQSVFGGWTSTSIQPGFFDVVPEVQWDSYLTIGSLDAVGTGTNASTNGLNTVAIDEAPFEAGGTLYCENGAVYITPDQVQGDAMPCVDACNRQASGVLLGQFTLLGDGAYLRGSMLVQGSNDQAEAFQHHIADFFVDADGVSSAGTQIGCAADLSGDDRVDMLDLLTLLERWDEGACQDITADLQVTADDVLAVCQAWGNCTP